MQTKLASSKPLGALLLLALAPALSAQLTSAGQAVSVTVQATESLTIAINTGGPVNFSLPGVGGSTTATVVPSWTTSWVLFANRTSVKVYAYFISQTALTGTSNPSNTISSLNFSGQANGGAATLFSGGAIQAVNVGGAGMLVSTTAITGGNLTGSKTDSLALTLNGQPTPYPSDTYSGTLLIQAQATP